MDGWLSTSTGEGVDWNVEPFASDCERVLHGDNPLTQGYEHDDKVYRIPLPNIDIDITDVELRKRRSQQARKRESESRERGPIIQRFQKMDHAFQRTLDDGTFAENWEAFCNAVEAYGVFIVAESLSSPQTLDMQLLNVKPELATIAQQGQMYTFEDGVRRKIIKVIIQKQRMSILTE